MQAQEQRPWPDRRLRARAGATWNSASLDCAVKPGYHSCRAAEACRRLWRRAWPTLNDEEHEASGVLHLCRRPDATRR